MEGRRTDNGHVTVKTQISRVNSNNSAASVTLEEVCALLSAILVLIVFYLPYRQAYKHTNTTSLYCLSPVRDMSNITTRLMLDYDLVLLCARS